ncbi:MULTISPECIES: flagellar export chaperone FliS [Sphingomonadales]|uniref:Flagellar protein FliS n=2 Tax=Edaphosphingomonas TaxID=3423724 RepID=A0A2T4I599_9SPHN|nr:MULTISPECIES: flagellar export chaperone FliS [Sphingomonas]AGH50373.1 flagellar protein FliS [Sphingomonas sp. MM-1]MDX3885717.1 flagellar protein FliS [Sphingomonas sp.]OHT18783.1 Flagellar protein FliS [Sphingomonas haloaromaticamans]PTD25139.1 flagellar protein FliS [Sphingomonas fennica]
MFGSAARARYAPAGARYQSVDIATRIEGAGPHRLVSILYEELLTRMALLKSGLVNGDHARRSDAQARSLAILAALENGLDHDKGGDVAPLLASVYAEASRLILRAVNDNDAAPLDTARSIIADIAEAWDRIR